MQLLATTFLMVVVTGTCVAVDPGTTTTTTSTSSDRVVVATENGMVSGIQETSTKGHQFYSFWSIPYAEPPTGDLRLQVSRLGSSVFRSTCY